MNYVKSFFMLLLVSICVLSCKKDEPYSVRFILTFNMDTNEYFITTHVKDVENIICVPYTLVDLESKIVQAGKTYKWRDGTYNKGDKEYTVFYSLYEGKVKPDELLVRAVSTDGAEVPLDIVFLSKSESRKRYVYYYHITAGIHDFILKKYKNKYYVESVSIK